MKIPLIFDTSVWIDYFTGKETRGVGVLSNYIERNEQICLTPTILQEILQGIKEDKQYVHIKEILSYFSMLELSPVHAAIGAAELYRSLRKKGATIRKSNDCLIAFFAIYFSIPLVHNDKDFQMIAEYSALTVSHA